MTLMLAQLGSVFLLLTEKENRGFKMLDIKKLHLKSQISVLKDEINSGLEDIEKLKSSQKVLYNWNSPVELQAALKSEITLIEARINGIARRMRELVEQLKSLKVSP